MTKNLQVTCPWLNLMKTRLKSPRNTAMVNIIFSVFVDSSKSHVQNFYVNLTHFTCELRVATWWTFRDPFCVFQNCLLIEALWIKSLSRFKLGFHSVVEPEFIFSFHWRWKTWLFSMFIYCTQCKETWDQLWSQQPLV